MAAKSGMIGLNTVLRNLNKAVRGIENRSQTGLLLVGQLIKRRSVQLTPVDTGNLRNSAYVTPMAHAVEIGYTASYAAYVHEVDKAYRAPGTGWKFLERAIRENTKAILDLIRKTARVI